MRTATAKKPRRRRGALGPRFADVDERAELLQELARGTCDRMRNSGMTLGAATGFLRNRLKRTIGRDREIGETLADIDATAKEIVAFADRLTAYAAPFWRTNETVRAADFIKSAVESLEFALQRSGGKADIDLQLHCGEASVIGQYAYLVNAIWHVLENYLREAQLAATATPPRKLRIRVAARIVGTAKRGRHLCVTIEDNGRGIREAVFEILFQPYGMAINASAWTGLGLASSNEIVQRYGGSIRAENRPEGGARFVIELPVARG